MSRFPAIWHLLMLLTSVVLISPANAEEARRAAPEEGAPTATPDTAAEQTQEGAESQESAEPAPIESAEEGGAPTPSEETSPPAETPTPQETPPAETTAPTQPHAEAHEAPTAHGHDEGHPHTGHQRCPRCAGHGRGHGHEGGDGGGCDCFFEGLTETAPAFSLSRGRVTLGIVGSIQLLAVPWVDDPMASIESGSIANAEGFRLRRARFGAVGELPHNFAFRLLFEHGDDGANILDAYVSYEPHELARLTAGALKVPFSSIMMQSSEYQSFLQRPYIVRSVSPDRALGFEVSGRSFFFTYHLGVFNGGGDYYRGDNNAGMLYAARFALHILGPLPDGEITQPDGLVFQVASSYYFNQDAAGNRHGVTGELALRWSRLTISGEFLWSTFDPATSPETGEGVEYGSTTRLGFYAQAGVFIINDHLQLSLRFEGQRLVEQGFEIQDLNDLWAIAPAISGYFLQGRIKLTLQYEHRHEWFEDQVRNDFLGLQVQGRI